MQVETLTATVASMIAGLQTIDFAALRVLGAAQRTMMPPEEEAQPLAAERPIEVKTESEAAEPASLECLTQAEAEAEAADRKTCLAAGSKFAGFSAKTYR